jgi:uncharacterized membrane protein (UPF0127 family)
MKILQFYLEQIQHEKTMTTFLSNFKRIIKFTSEKDHSIGLLRYKSIPENIAFLFEFENDKIRNFHSVGMKFNIDIFFYDKHGDLIINYKNIKPGIKKISSKEECRFAIETLSRENIKM